MHPSVAILASGSNATLTCHVGCDYKHVENRLPLKIVCMMEHIKRPSVQYYSQEKKLTHTRTNIYARRSKNKDKIFNRYPYMYSIDNIMLNLFV